MRNWLIGLYTALALLGLGIVTTLHAEEVLHESVLLLQGMLCDTPEEAAESFGAGAPVGSCGFLFAPAPVRIVRVGTVNGHALVRYEFLLQEWVQYGIGPADEKAPPEKGA
jgi:hypothetical protein